MKNLPIVIIIICLSTRLVFFMAIGAWSPIVANEIMPYADPDTLDYHKLAISIVEKHQFVEDGKVETLRVPLYPLFISSFYAIFGEKPWIILLIQIVLDTCSCVLLFFIISRLINYESAFYGSLFYALDPFLIFYSNMLLSDVLFVFICVLAFYFLSKAVSRRPMQSMSVYLLCSAFFFGMATLVRPIAQYIPFVVAFLLLVILIRKVKNALKYSIIFLVVFLIVLSPWLIRNYIMFNVPSLSTSGAYNLVVLYVAPMEAERRGQPTKVVANTLLNEANQLIIRDGLDPNNLNDFVKAKYWQKVAVQYIKNRPMSFIKHYMFGISDLFFTLGTRGYADMLQIRNDQTRFYIKDYHNIFDMIEQWIQQKTLYEILIGIIIAIYLLLSYISLLVGLVVSWNNYDRKFVYTCMFLLLYFIIITGTAGIARFKLPCIPFYLVFAGIGLSSMRSMVISRFGLYDRHQELSRI